MERILDELLNESTWVECDHSFGKIQSQFMQFVSKVDSEIEIASVVREIFSAPGKTNGNDRYVEDIARQVCHQGYYRQTRLYDLAFRFQEMRRQYLLKKSDKRIAEGNVQGALDVLEMLLSQNPCDDDFIQRVESLHLQSVSKSGSRKDLNTIKCHVDGLRQRFYIKQKAKIDVTQLFRPHRHDGVTFISNAPNGMWIAAGCNYVLRCSFNGLAIDRVDFGLNENCCIWQAHFCPRTGCNYLLARRGKSDAETIRLFLKVIPPKGLKLSHPPDWRFLKNPRGLSISSDGRMAVGDLENRQVHLFSADHKRVFTIGLNGDMPLMLRTPTATGFVGRDCLLIGDQQMACVYKIDLVRKKVIWTSAIPNVRYLKPFVNIDSQGAIYVAGVLENRLIKISPDGEIRYQLPLPTLAANGVFAHDDKIFVHDSKCYEIISYEVA
ncbi:NHL repeat-containing protein [Desulfosarcina alkanivorans]|uniref:hypothetical protein n=1 Tax=Desulfosarcina alkanivorans TaxID=571177 RepID=UPI0012D36F32|nr:hypothetical protein [Desulfosarcina alkanivorans]